MQGISFSEFLAKDNGRVLLLDKADSQRPTLFAKGVEETSGHRCQIPHRTDPGNEYIESKNTRADALQIFSLFTLAEVAKSKIKVLPISMFGESLLFVSWVSFLMADTLGSSVGFLL